VTHQATCGGATPDPLVHDGQSFVAKAVGDLDCDGTFITYELTGMVRNGSLSTTLIEPAPNAD